MSNEQPPTPSNNEHNKGSKNSHLIQKAIVALNEKNAGATCDFCGQKEFVAASEIVALVCLDAENNAITLGRHFPCVALFCKNCGNTKLFNAKALRVL